VGFTIYIFFWSAEANLKIELYPYNIELMPRAKKDTTPKASPSAEPDEDIVDDVIDNEFKEEEFFNQDSYYNFIKKNHIEPLSNSYTTNNDLHHEVIVVPQEYRITSEIMTLAEYARVKSERAKQIENGSPIFINIKNDHDPIIIAEKEIKQKKSPMIIERFLTKNIKEEWVVNEMIVPFI
jgi:DNA-directed RNA polymerase I, II, and III subunit RPABC2